MGQHPRLDTVIAGPEAIEMTTNGHLAHYSITLKTVNPQLKHIEYATVGPLVSRARMLEEDLKNGVQLPFAEVVKANIGDAQALGQLPITYIREVLASVTLPSLMDEPRFAEDVKAKARAILAACEGGSVGAYSEVHGLLRVRKNVARFIERRDGGIPSDHNNIVITSGATHGIKSVLKLLMADVNGKKPGVMMPIPQYPLYRSTLVEYNLAEVAYYLDEGNQWSLDVEELERSITEARKTCHPRAIVVINPGNPTGQVLTRSNIEEIIMFAHREELFIIADEVYQDNIYSKGSEFHSFKKVMTEMGAPYCNMELASFMSCSKCYMGECGLRGGYVEIINLQSDVYGLFMNLMTADTCPTVIGQAVLDCVVAPPQPGDESYETFRREKAEVLRSLGEKARLVDKGFSSIQGMSHNNVQGAMYAFPQVHLPPAVLELAREAGVSPDTFYAAALLEETGICVVPGAGFGQKPGTHHFRMTILPPVEKLKVMITKIQKFHKEFLEQYE